MVSGLSHEVTSRRAVSGGLGKQLLDVITSGMYSDPRMSIREYIQNAADSIDLAHELRAYTDERPYIKLTLDGRERVVTVEDNGSGIEGRDVDAHLGTLGCSSKSAGGRRGFRGIGRLGGLAYCDMLHFETRRTAREPVHVVEWNGKALRDQVAHPSSHEQLTDAVRRIAYTGHRRANPTVDPAHFFRARMVNVHRFHSDLLMNVKGLREYLAQTAPVAFDSRNFPFASRIEKHLNEVPGYRAYDVILNGTSVLRPYQVDISVREGVADIIRDIELVECVGRQGELLCRGWFAQTGFLSALPQHVAMRGVRIRQGNIGVGDEYFLKDLFSESRFATWHIGELHVTPALKLNARRDGFEESSEYETFLEWTSSLCKQLSGYCRQFSKDRSAKQSVERLFKDLELKLTTPFFVDEMHAQLYIEGADQQLKRLRQILANSSPERQKVADSLAERIAVLGDRPLYLRDVIDGRALRGKDNRQLLVDVCKRILTTQSGNGSQGLVLDIIRPYLKQGFD
jgi:molecular chaperone HtpG